MQYACEFAPEADHHRTASNDVFQGRPEGPAQHALFAGEHLEHLQSMGVNDQPMAEAVDTFPHAETLRKDHIGPQGLEFLPCPVAVPPQFAQVEFGPVDVGHVHLTYAQGRIEDPDRMRVQHGEFHPARTCQMLG